MLFLAHHSVVKMTSMKHIQKQGVLLLVVLDYFKLLFWWACFPEIQQAKSIAAAGFFISQMSFLSQSIQC